MREKVIKRFEEDKGFINKNGFKIVELDEEHAKMEYVITKFGLNPIDVVHGGLLFGLADTTAVVLASMTGKFPLTVNSSINFISTANGKKLYAVAKILKVKNHIGYYEVNIYNDKDELVCTSLVDFYFIKEK